MKGNQVMCRSTTWLVLMLLVVGIGTTFAKGPAYISADAADEDFRFQGEYVGSHKHDGEEMSVGVQVIALGQGEFTAVVYPGGLPGAGWIGEQKMEVKGQRDGDTVKITHEGTTGVIRNGVITVTGDDGTTLVELKKVTRESDTLAAKPPAGAQVLFDGTGTDQWKDGKLADDRTLMQGTTSVPTFQSHRLHIEFRLPYQPEDRGQARGNSGIYLQGRYEVQMLDSFGLQGMDNECGGLYEIKAPDVNMCLPPLQWQTYDIEFHAAKYNEAGEVTANPRITVVHNGTKIHDNVELPRSTRAAPNVPGPEPGPVYLQDHGNPIRYRNIWVVPIED